MVMMGAVMVIVFMTLFSELYQDNLKDKKKILAEDYGYYLQTELILASEAKSGYKRVIDIPYDLEGFDFDLYLISSVLIINFSDAAIPFNVPKVNGQLVKGKNTIENTNNSICLNC